MAEPFRAPPSSRFPLLYLVPLLLLALSSRLSNLALFAFPFLAVTGIVAVLVGDVWLSHFVERRVRRRALGGSGGASGGGTARGKDGRRPLVPPLYFTSPAAWSKEQTKAGWEKSADPSRLSFPDAPPFLTSAIDSLLSLILRDFVLKWYSGISDSPAFPNAVESTIRETLLAFSTRFASVDFTELVVARLLPLLTSHLENFRTAELSVHGRAWKLGAPDTDDLDLFVASRYASEQQSNKLHPAVDVASTNSRPAEEEWLRSLIDSILPLVVPERELDSLAVRMMVRELVSCAVLLPIFEMLGDPDFYNRIIDDKAGAAIRDQRMVDQFREALDKQGPALVAATVRSFTAPKPPVPTRPRKTEAVTVRTNARQFESWLKGISQIGDVGDAKRLRSDVAGQIRKAKSLTDGKGFDEVVDGFKVSEWVDYIERLYSAKRKVDRRIGKLGGVIGSSRASIFVSSDSHAKPISLRNVLLEPAAVTYLFEFLERRKHSIRAQFWLLVEGLKDPLEDLDGDKPFSTSTSTSTPSASTAFEDVRMIWEAYLARDPFSSNPRHLAAIRTFVEAASSTPPSPQDVRQVRHALFSLQGDVLTLLEEEDFPLFVRSDLYFKAITDFPSSRTPPLPASPLLITPPTLPSSLPITRPRSRSNPQLPPLRTSPSPSLTRAAIPTLPPRPASPAFPHQTILQRTETAPPLITHTAAFTRPKAARRTGSFDASDELHTSRKVSGGSLDTLSSSLTSAGKRKSGTLGESLDFLMSPPATAIERSPLFSSELSADEIDPLEEGKQDDSPPSDDDYVQVQTIEAIQDALTSILATNDKAQSTPPTATKSTASLASLVSSPSSSVATLPAYDGKRLPPSGGRPQPPPRHHSLNVSSRPDLPPAPRSKQLTPVDNLSATSSLLTSVKPRVKAVFDDEESLDDLGLVDDEPEPEFDPASIRVAAPGDLHLHGEVDRLAESLDKLVNQLAVVDALIRKAELTGNASELKILVKSRDSLRREIRAATFQKDQFEAQASENQLSADRTRVAIPGTTVGQAGGQSFQLYLVEVHQLNAEGVFRSGWIVTRRYSEFAALYAQLKDKYTAARYLEFPSKRLVGTYSSDFIEQRRIGLERYLQALIKIPVVCRSNELRAFLSQATIALPKTNLDRRPAPLPPFFAPGQNLVRTLYRGLTSGIDDVLGTSTTSMMDQVIERLSQQAAEFAGMTGASVNDEDLVGQLLADQSASPSAGVTVGEEGLTSFTAPIADLFITIFELKEKGEWLRRQAILIVLQQVLGSTLERKFRDSVKMLFAPAQLVTYISTLQSSLWPDGEMKPKAPPRTAAEKLATKESAGLKLAALMPDVAANLIGRQNARQGARSLFAVLQNRRLNKHLIYSIVDEVILVLFPELTKKRAAGPDTLRPLFLS